MTALVHVPVSGAAVPMQAAQIDVARAEREQLIADLKASRAQLVYRGRAVGDFVDEHGHVCAIGAVGMAVVDGFDTMSFESRGEAIDRETRPNRVLAALNRQVREHHADEFPSPYLGPDKTFMTAWRWNDLLATTDQDVLDLFDKALAELGGLG